MENNLVILSGGADSTICAAIAAKRGDTHAITFNYGQRHDIEIGAAEAVAKALNLISHEIIFCPMLLKSTSPLVSVNQVEQYESAERLPDGVASTLTTTI